MFFFSI
jgi:hypothetical protein